MHGLHSPSGAIDQRPVLHQATPLPLLASNCRTVSGNDLDREGCRRQISAVASSRSGSRLAGLRRSRSHTVVP